MAGGIVQQQVGIVVTGRLERDGAVADAEVFLVVGQTKVETGITGKDPEDAVGNLARRLAGLDVVPGNLIPPMGGGK